MQLFSVLLDWQHFMNSRSIILISDRDRNLIFYKQCRAKTHMSRALK